MTTIKMNPAPVRTNGCTDVKNRRVSIQRGPVDRLVGERLEEFFGKVTYLPTGSFVQGTFTRNTAYFYLGGHKAPDDWAWPPRGHDEKFELEISRPADEETTDFEIEAAAEPRGLRPFVAELAEAMESRMADNDHRNGSMDPSTRELTLKLTRAVADLLNEDWEGGASQYDAADVANLAGMLAKAGGALLPDWRAQATARETPETIREWGDEALGEYASVTSAVGRAMEEFAELIQKLGHFRTAEGAHELAKRLMLSELGDKLAEAESEVLEEMADVVIVLCRAAPRDLWAAVERKMARNRARKWERSGPPGCGRHA